MEAAKEGGARKKDHGSTGASRAWREASLRHAKPRGEGQKAFWSGWASRVREGAGYAAGSQRARAWGILAMRRHQPRQPPPSTPPRPRGFVW